MAIVSNKKGGSKYLLGFITILLLYCFIFNPPFRFLPVGLTKFMYIMALPFFLIPTVRRNYWARFSSVTLLLVACIIYTFFIHFAYSSRATIAQTSLFLLFESFFTAYIIAYYLVKLYKDKADLMVLWTTIIACVITVVLIVMPDLNASVREMSSLADDERLRDILTYRGFGIADDLLFTYPIALSVGACICMQYARRNKLYYAFIIFFFFGIFFNARIGMVPILIYILYIIVIEHKFSLLVQLSLVVLLLVLFFMQTDLFEEHANTIEWIAEGFMEISNFLSGEQSSEVSTFDALSEMIVVPDSAIGVLFGTGRSVYLERNNSDIGYIIQLNYGGIVFVLFYVLIVYKLYKKLKRCSSHHRRWFNYVFIGTFLICNVKGFFFSTLSGVRMLMLLFFVYVLLRNSVSFKES